MTPVACCLLLWLTTAAFAAPRNLEHLYVSGSEYVRLVDWCEATGFALKWNKRDREMEVTGPARLNLEVDSRKLEINGVTVLLSLPIVNRGGVALISAADVRTTLEPLLFPKKTPKRVKTICLDPGHGGKDTGKAVGEYYEKTYTLLLARATAELLRKEGFKVVLTRDTDEMVELPERPLRAAREGADLFVSLHYNGGAADLRGVEVFCMTPAGLASSNEAGGPAEQAREMGNEQDERNVLLAFELQKCVTRALPLEDRGMKRARFEVLREARQPAVLIEGGFLSNTAEARNIFDASFRQRMAQAIVSGILAYQRAIEPKVEAN
jgi:N-acetylmuramoyl-L-alanine amidase